MKGAYGWCVLFCCLLLTACSGRKAPAPVAELYQGKTFRDVQKSSYNSQIYTVEKGDTLFSISWKSGQDYRDIARFNNIRPPYNIFPGQRLTLKKQSRSIIKKSNNGTGLSSKSKSNQVVDPPKKQAYGESNATVKKEVITSSSSEFPNKITAWLWPTKNTVSRGFSNTEHGNKGLDFNGTLGSPILATAAGKVVYTGDALRGYGKLVIVKHSDSFLSAYAHNDSILVKEQQWVRAGQKIATMGKSGSDTVKLHFEVRYKGQSVDPLRYLPKR
ncbi:peptidoglycan DD-metalloendopeptidase family protein [Paraglaciecola polaris]|uniref:Lipoprotein NlpD n=1 Tax=Paraglaciecola polaris LMG 21857 TaxID=1129793 RepID=K6ZN66_9ALTE|nr:peptidoglycan DD-metalloendopeptidase family protein [Paraglaciecola polaris]GAC31762.1 lipoprotein NlpD [Paraglaciecola polaris LMG 21857]|tara:strand:- start:10622 stop:11440 length:819 start_codon:yes stop_codon:yes gene_type:complete